MYEDIIREELQNCREILADIFQSGLIAVSDSLLDRLKSEALTVSQYGMKWLSGQIDALYKQLESRRHTLAETEDVETVRLFCTIDRYLEIGIRQTELDEAVRRFTI